MKHLITAICLIFALSASALAQCGSTCTLNPPGLRYPLIDWRFVNGGALPQTHGVFMKEDTISIKVESGNRLALTPDEMEVILTSSVSWKKQLAAFNPCTGKTTTITTEGSFQGPVRMRVKKTTACFGETIILRKDKAFQGMVDMYHMDPSRFWRLWAGKIITINWTQDFVWGSYPPACSFPCVPVATDPDAGLLYDTDSKADIAVFRQNGQTNISDWFAINSSTGLSLGKRLGQFNDRPVPYDYDGDGRTDIAVWRRDTGEWIIISSLTGQTRVIQWGTSGDMPAPGDYDGDGKADLAFWHPANGMWFIKSYMTGAESTFQSSSTAGVEVAADYDGDGKTDPATWNSFNGVWVIFTNPTRVVSWGASGDLEVAADYDGDRKTDYAVWRNGLWLIKNSNTGVESSESFGTWGDQPVPRDYDGDGKADLAVFRPWTSEWFIKRSSDGAIISGLFGGEGDVPVSSK